MTTKTSKPKTFYVCIHGHIGRLLDLSDCIIAKNKKDAIAICKADKDGDTGYVAIKVNKDASELYIKKMALAEIW